MSGLFKISTTMKRRICYILMATLLVTGWVCVKGKPFSPYGAANQQVDQTTRIQDVPGPSFDSTQGTENLKAKANSNGYDYKEALRGLRRIGSTPPRCQHKCFGCVPCDPIQIPTNKNVVGVQYTNYKPEGWKCKCGNSYFNP